MSELLNSWNSTFILEEQLKSGEISFGDSPFKETEEILLGMQDKTESLKKQLNTFCSICSKEGTLKCSRCKTKKYCSPECQRIDWRVHKKTCIPCETNTSKI